MRTHLFYHNRHQAEIDIIIHHEYSDYYNTRMTVIQSPQYGKSLVPKKKGTKKLPAVPPAVFVIFDQSSVR